MLEPRECLKHVLQAVERHAPLTHCMTNQVAAPLTANAILACGASPVMVLEKSECRDIARVADGLLVNIGTFTARQGEAMATAIDGMRARARPWILDPVAYGRCNR